MDELLKLIKLSPRIKTKNLLNKASLDPSTFSEQITHLVSLNKIAIDIFSDEVFLLDNEVKKGNISINQRGFGFIRDDENAEESFFVPAQSLNNAISRDEVLFVLKKEADGKSRAEVIAIVKREKKFLVGEIQLVNDKFLDFIPSEQDFLNYRIVMVNKNDFSLKVGLLVKVKLLDVRDRKLFVRLVEIIGDGDKAYDRILAIAEEFNILTEFKKQTLKEAETLNTPIDFNDEHVKRRFVNDLRKVPLVTIDGADSKDLDDAIFVEQLSNHTYKLIVAIADVSYYVRPKSMLDKEALVRGNSTYLANMVLPMLPKTLSNGICSLNPSTDRLSLVCEMILNESGMVVQKRVYESIINTAARLTYDEVNVFYQTGELNHAQEVKGMLTKAKRLHEVIDVYKIKKGTIDFEVTEPKIIMDNDFNVIDIKARARGVSERLIENFMVAANESVAELVFDLKLPFLYRDHGLPNTEGLLEWYKSLKFFGINVNLTNEQKIMAKNIVSTLEQISKQVSDPKVVELINITLLRHMDKARYDLVNIGHFGLASECYTHFTSPIRRYSDLVVHRFLKAYLIDKQVDETEIQSNTKLVNSITPIINETEKQSVNCEREVVKVCSAEYLTKHIGEIREGIISAVLKFGFFVQLENAVEGLVHISTIAGEPVYDEKTNTLTTKQNIQFGIGKRVEIKITNANVKTRKIDFQLL